MEAETFTMHKAAALLLILLMVGSAYGGWIGRIIVSSGERLYHVEIGDIDNDGHPEIYTLSYYGRVSRYTNQSGHWVKGWSTEVPGYGDGLVVGDFDSSVPGGEVYVATQYYDDLGQAYPAVYEYYRQSGTWYTNPHILTGPGKRITSFTGGPGSFDSQDHLYLGLSDGSVCILDPAGPAFGCHGNVSSVLPSGQSTYATALYAYHHAVYIGTESNDIMTLRESSGGLWDMTLLGHGTGSPVKHYIESIAAADLNGNGAPEVYAASSGSSLIYIESSTGTVYSYGETVSFHSLVISDLYMDGYSRIIAGASNRNIYEFNCTPSGYTWRYVGMGSDNVRDVAVGDIDEDGYNEVVGVCEDGKIWKFKLDTEPPQDVIVWSTTHEPSVWSNNNRIHVEWMVNGTDPSGIGGFSFNWSTDGPRAPPGRIMVGAAANNTTSPPMPDGKDIWFSISAVDNAGNWQVVPSIFGPVFIDTHSPEIKEFTIDNNLTYTNDLSVVLKISASDNLSGVKYMRFSNDGSNWSAWTEYKGAYDWDLGYGREGRKSGERTVYAQVMDVAGNIGEPAADTITLDIDPPVLTDFTINRGSPVTSDPLVSLEIQAYDNLSGIYQMSFSNDKVSWSEWEAYCSSRLWSLVEDPGGEDADGEKTVYVRLMDRAGNIGYSGEASVDLDRTAPGVHILLNGNELVSHSRGVKYELEWEENLAGPDAYRLRVPPGDWGDWTPKDEGDTIELSGTGVWVVDVQGRDKAGNTGDPTSSYVVVNTNRPLIYDVMIAESGSKAAVMWRTNVPASGTVSWGPEGTYSKTKKSGTGTLHSVQLLNLKDGEVYSIKITAECPAGKSAVEGITFVHREHADSRQPEIYDLHVHTSETSAVLYWRTDEPSTTQVTYSVEGKYSGTVSSSDYTLEHQVVLTGLEPGKEYSYKISSMDLSGNGPTLVKGGFTAGKPAEQPRIMNLRVTAVYGHSALVEWNTDIPSISIVEYWKEGARHIAVNDLYTYQHQMVLPGLTLETEYSFRAYSASLDADAPVESEVHTFTTPGSEDTQAPEIYNVRATPSGSDTAVIYWMTDEPATSGVAYRTNSTSVTLYDWRYTTEHTVVLRGLHPGTQYWYTVFSQDVPGNGPSYSTEHSFSTPTAKDRTPPNIISVSVFPYASSAVVVWNTDEPSKGEVRYGAGSMDMVYREETIKKLHSVVLEGLKSQTTYRFVVKAWDAAGNGPSISEEHTFTTSAGGTGGVSIEGVHTYPFSGGVEITWSTTAPARADVVIIHQDRVVKHITLQDYTMNKTINLTGLEPDTQYSYQLKVWDITDAADMFLGDFRTLKAEPPAEPPGDGGGPETPETPQKKKTVAFSVDTRYVLLLVAVLAVAAFMAGAWLGYIPYGRIPDTVVCPHCSAEVPVRRRRRQKTTSEGAEGRPPEAEEAAEPEEEPEPEPVPVKYVRCPGCRTRIPVTSPERPLRIECPTCHRRGVIRK